VYHVFERLNTGGMQLQSQEIRACVLYGALSDFLSKLNDNKDWRSIFGQKSLRLKDQELILRFFALYYHLDRYERPIKEFLNDYMGANRDLSKQTARELQDRFAKPIGLIAETIGQDAFRPERALNASVFDGVMVGLARRLEHGPIEDKVGFQRAYRELLKDKTFLETTQTGTSDVPVVRKRIELATSAFSGLQ
jgi:hypothetical protein